jgi:hypothetical protein
MSNIKPQECDIIPLINAPDGRWRKASLLFGKWMDRKTWLLAVDIIHRRNMLFSICMKDFY